MAIKIDTQKLTYSVSYSKRHPITKKPISMKRIGIASKAEARRVYENLILLVNEKIKKKIVPVWGEFLCQYFDNLKLDDITNTTIYNREKVLRYHTLPAWENRFLDEITPHEIQILLKSRLGENTESHRKYFLKCVRSVFQFAFEMGVINRNPTPMIKFKVNDKIRSVLNEDQIITLLRKSQELEWPWYSHYAVGLFTGMRSGEMYALTWDKVNLEKRQILVNCSWSSKDGYKSTKSGDDRIVEIPKPLVPVLAELKLKSAGMDFVLPRLSRWDKGEQARELRFFLKSVGLPEIRFHDLRASWATLLLGKGVAPSKVMAMGGWKDMDTMMIYMRKAGINIKNSTSVLDDMQTHGVEAANILTFK